MNDTKDDFSGVYYFTNPTDVDRKYLWNNKEYTFPANTTVPLIIASESLENIQEIRKRFAYRMAEERWYEGAEYKKMSQMGGGIPPTFDPKILEPMIEECLKPLPKGRAKVNDAKIATDDRSYKATKAMGEADDPNALFAEENRNPQKFGKM